MATANVIVLDTAALIWWLTNSDRLSRVAAHTIDGAESLAISSISAWEIALKVSQRRLVLPRPLKQFVPELETLQRLQVIPVDARLWLDSVLLDWEHRDPADRVIVALARAHDCELVTSDRVIAGFYPKTVW